MKFILNKAIVCYKLNLINEYGENADKALVISVNNKKALYHKIKSLILKEKYLEAKEMINNSSQILDEELQK